MVTKSRRDTFQMKKCFYRCVKLHFFNYWGGGDQFLNLKYSNAKSLLLFAAIRYHYKMDGIDFKKSRGRLPKITLY